MAAEFPDHPFWDFSLRVYGSEGVPEACLVLQERHGIDVNVLLYCFWLGASGRGTLDDGEIAAVCRDGRCTGTATSSAPSAPSASG